MGVISAIGGYNFGCFNSLAIEHNELSSVSVDISHKRDKRRLAQSEKKNSSDWRKKRIINKLAKSSKITKNIKKKKGKHMVLWPSGSVSSSHTTGPGFNPRAKKDRLSLSSLQWIDTGLPSLLGDSTLKGCTQFDHLTGTFAHAPTSTPKITNTEMGTALMGS
ncbi:hypothetical protein TNCV_3246151 [Trichonephila clavipes]|nr:hypothetical protein TNCV_3246151 [Trichonephila clavipes]